MADSVSDEEAARWRELAENATPGPWFSGDNYLIGGRWIVTDPDDPERTGLVDLITTDADAAFIAALNPSAVVRLLEERDRLRGVIEATIALEVLGAATMAKNLRNALVGREDG